PGRHHWPPDHSQSRLPSRIRPQEPHTPQLDSKFRIPAGKDNLPDVLYSDPGDGYDLLGTHTYAATGTYTISVTVELTAGDCTGNGFTAQFTLLPTAAPPPPPSVHGEACVFNAPTGGIDKVVHGVTLFVSGHVGWAYLADPATGTWEFGANEGFTHKIGDRSKTWLDEGTWADVISVFKDAKPGGKGKNKYFYHPGNYYRTYRCTSVAAFLPDIALDVAKNQYGEKYKIPGSDCLSQTVDVLAVYGASINDSSYLLNTYYWVPNNYYHSGYMSHFGPEHKL
ncbi:MAG: hypothetical protein ACRDOU_28565, partial [Streptosporangiaceae bacterium]